MNACEQVPRSLRTKDHIICVDQWKAPNETFYYDRHSMIHERLLSALLLLGRGEMIPNVTMTDQADKSVVLPVRFYCNSLEPRYLAGKPLCPIKNAAEAYSVRGNVNLRPRSRDNFLNFLQSASNLCKYFAKP